MNRSAQLQFGRVVGLGQPAPQTESDLEGGDALLLEAWNAKRESDPANLVVRTLPVEVERSLRAAGNESLAEAWRQRLDGLTGP